MTADRRHPFFRPRWRRIAAVAVCAAWAALELAAGEAGWAAVALAATAYATWAFLIAYEGPAGRG